MNTFFLADTHFGDGNIIRYENRPFADVAEMDEILIKNWNEAVSASDKVFLIGDFSAYGFDKSSEICKRLNGEKFLIIGNHDTENEQYYRDCGFTEVSRYPIIYENFWILSHEPLYVNQNMPYANIFGHVHGNPIYSDFSAQSFCVSAERTNYRPMNFSEIKECIQNKSKEQSE